LALSLSALASTVNQHWRGRGSGILSPITQYAHRLLVQKGFLFNFSLFYIPRILFAHLDKKQFQIKLKTAHLILSETQPYSNGKTFDKFWK